MHFKAAPMIFSVNLSRSIIGVIILNRRNRVYDVGNEK
jgi:hypothetical protein